MNKRYFLLLIILILLSTNLMGKNGIIGIQIIYEEGKNIVKMKSELEPQFFNVNMKSDPPGLEIVIENAKNRLKKSNFSNLPKNSLIREIKIGKKTKEGREMITMDLITRDKVNYYVTKTNPGGGRIEIMAKDYPSFSTWQYAEVAEKEEEEAPSEAKEEEAAKKKEEKPEKQKPKKKEPRVEKEFEKKVPEGQYIVKGLRLNSKEEKTIFRIKTSKEPRFYNINLRKEPPGLIIELSGARNHLKKSSFEQLPSKGLINSISLKQTRLEPSPLLTIKLATKEMIKYYVNRTTPSYAIIEILSSKFPKIRSWNYEKLRRVKEKEEKEKKEKKKEEPPKKKKKEKKEVPPSKTQKKIPEPDYRIGGIMLNYHHDTTRFHIITNTQPQPEVDILRHPPRIRLNFPNGQIEVDERDFKDLPNNVIMRVTLKQEIKEDMQLGKVILYLADKPRKFTKKINEQGMVVKIPTKDYPDFSSWTYMKSEALASKEESSKATQDTTDGDGAEETGPELPLYRRLRVDYKLYEGDTSAGKADTSKPISDPFKKPDITAQEKFGRPEVPKVENLELVGVVLKEGEHVGILQDSRGYGYVLSPGDTIENGKVVEVSKNLIKFNITEFGWTREMELKLEEEKSES